MASTAVRITNYDQLPVWARPVADQIQAFGYDKWEFDPTYPVTDAYTTQRVQVRDEEHTGQRTEVTHYAQAMKRVQFPPGVVTSDGRYVDFNTRARAAHKLGWPGYPVFILNVDFGRAGEAQQKRVRLLAAAFNTKGPKPLTRDEQAAIIRQFADDPAWETEKIADHLGVTPATVNNVFAQIRAESKAAQLGVPFNGKVSATVRATLGGKTDKLTDPLFCEITRLTQDAGLNIRELRELCNHVQGMPGSEADKLNVINDWRGERSQQIAHFKASGKAIPPPSAEMRGKMAFILRHEGHAADLVDYNPGTAAEYLIKLETCQRVLADLVIAQRQSIETQ
jgi:hypothetical protein